MFTVTDAVREKLYAAVALIGASGSGKTLSALIMAYGMMKEKYPELSDDALWQKIGLVDTEHKRSLVYANTERLGVQIKSFKHIDFKAPYSPERYKGAVKALKDQGCEVVVIDSLSHAWEAEGGLLDMQQAAGGTFQAWNKVKPHIQDFIKTLTQSDVHVFGTMRTKQDYVVETSELGKASIKKVGLKVIQKDDLEYEFQITFNIDMDHNVRVGKDNSGIFDGKVFRLDAESGKNIYEWLELGVDVKAEEKKKVAEAAAKVRKLQELNKDEKLDKYVAEIEKKANAKVEDFPLTLAERALMLIENKTAELGGKLK